MAGDNLSSLGALSLALYIFIFAFIIVAMILFFFVLHNYSLHGIDQIHYSGCQHFMV